MRFLGRNSKSPRHVAPPVALLLAALLAAGQVPASAATVNVNVGNVFFNPSTVNISVGDTVKWTWVSGTHSTTSGTCTSTDCVPDGKWDSGVHSNPGFTFEHTFDEPGDFPYFCSIHIVSQKGKVVVNAPPDPLAAVAGADPVSGTAPLIVTFSGSATGGTPPYGFSWNFGDGSAPSSEQNPTHTYAEAGTYQVELTVSDAASGTASDSHISIAAAAPPCTMSCVAAAEPASGPAPLQAAFSAAVTMENCQGSPSYSWDFGDGTTSQEQSPSHSYTEPGDYPWTFSSSVDGSQCQASGVVQAFAPGQKPGDCDGNDVVTIGEVQRAINMFLGTAVIECNVDCNGDGTISIGEVQKVINAFLGVASSC